MLVGAVGADMAPVVTAAPTLWLASIQPRLQDHRSSDLVHHLATVAPAHAHGPQAALGLDRRQPLVPGHDGDRQRGPQLVDLVEDRPGGRPDRPVERQRQPDHHDAGLRLAHQRGDATVVADRSPLRGTTS